LTSFGSGKTDIIRFWKRADGTSCIVARRENALYIRIEHNGALLKEQTVESPQHAMELAKLWDKEFRE
jgi:hypothetical protein